MTLDFLIPPDSWVNRTELKLLPCLSFLIEPLQAQTFNELKIFKASDFILNNNQFNVDLLFWNGQYDENQYKGKLTAVIDRK